MLDEDALIDIFLRIWVLRVPWMPLTIEADVDNDSRRKVTRGDHDVILHLCLYRVQDLPIQ